MKLLMFLNLIILTKNQQYKILKLENYSITQDIWNKSQKYIYYIDIQDYKIEEENILQIYNEDFGIITNINVTEINE
jgi:predicted RNA-binding protein associated with RNAse of E/G family